MPDPVILIVDDDPDIAEAMGLVLESTGATVHFADGVDEGLNTAQETQPNLILLDLMLPEPNDGYFFVHRLRTESMGEVANVPIILLSSLTRSEMDDLQYPEVDGAPFTAGDPVPIAAFLEKPAAPTRLLQVAQEHYP